ARSVRIMNILELARQVREHQRPPNELNELNELSPPTWPERCLESGRLFGQPHARLFPLLDKNVVTARGQGVLHQVFAERAAVLLDGQDALTFLHPSKVLPGTNFW